MEISSRESSPREISPTPTNMFNIPQNVDVLSKDFHHMKRKLTSFLSPETAADNFIFKTSYASEYLTPLNMYHTKGSAPEKLWKSYNIVQATEVNLRLI